MAELRTAPGGRRGSIVFGIVMALLIVAVLVAGGAYYLVRSLLVPGWVRANVIPALEAHYGRRIFFEDFRLRPRGIILDGVRVFEDPAFDIDGLPFLSVDHVVVRFDPLGLLRRTFLIDFVRLDHPEIHLYQDASRRWNATSLFKASSQPLPKTPDSASRIMSRFRLVVTRVELADATLRIARSPDPGKTTPKEMSVEDFDGTVMFHPMTGFLDYEAHGGIALPGRSTAAITAFGVLDLGTPRVELQISADDLDADAVRAFWTDPKAPAASFAFDDLVQADVDHDLLFVAKRLHIGGLDVGAVRVELDASPRAIELRKLDAAIFGGTLHATGNADLTATPPTFDVSATVDSFDLAPLAVALDRKPVSDAAPGKVSGTLAIAGPWSADKPLRPVLTLDFALDRLDAPALASAFEHPDKAAPSRDVGVDTKTWTVNVTAAAKTVDLGGVTLDAAKLRAKIGKGELDVVELSGRAFDGHLLTSGRLDLASASHGWHGQLALNDARFEQFVPETPRADWARTTGTVDVDLEVAARGLTLDAIRASLSGRDGSSPEQAYVRGNARIGVRALDLDLIGHPPRERDEYGPFELGNVAIDAHVTSDRVRLWHLDYENVTADAHLEREHISVSRIVGAISQGELELSGDVDLARKGLAYHGQGSFKQVETETFVNAYLPPDVGYVSGSGSAAFEFSLTGTKKDSALDSLALDGYVALHSGQVRDSRVFKHIAESLGVKEFKELELTRCGGDVHIGTRRVSTERLVLGGTDARVLLVGSVGFDKTLSSQVWLGFSPGTQRSMFSRGILLPYVTDDKGWTYVPFVTTGTLKDPQIKIADEAIRTTAIRAIPDATERIVRESSKLVPGGEAIVGGGIDAVKYILGGLGRVLQANSARAKGEIPLDEPVLPGQTRTASPPAAPARPPAPPTQAPAPPTTAPPPSAVAPSN